MEDLFLKKISLLGFKNYKDASFSFSDGFNFITGKNGSGKTNILDAIHFLGLSKSYMGSADKNAVNFNENFYLIEGDFDIDKQHEVVVCSYKHGHKKKLKRNNKEYERIADHIGRYPIVFISPMDSDLIELGGEARRKFLDSVISQYDADYLNNLIEYNKVLKQKNRYLKNSNLDHNLIDIWDALLLTKGKQIHASRKHFIEKIEPVLQDYYSNLNSIEQIGIKYASQLKGFADTQVSNETRQKDMVMRHSTFGIHRDDVIFEFQGNPIKKFGSQGQRKSFLVALKFAQFSFMNERIGRKPILLLDDIFDKLDEERVQNLILLADKETFGQVFITDTNPLRLEDLRESIINKDKITINVEA